MTEKGGVEKVVEGAAKATLITMLTTGTGAVVDSLYESATGKKSNWGTAFGALIGTGVSAIVGIQDAAAEIEEAESTDGDPVNT